LSFVKAFALQLQQQADTDNSVQRAVVLSWLPYNPLVKHDAGYIILNATPSLLHICLLHVPAVTAVCPYLLLLLLLLNCLFDFEAAARWPAQRSNRHPQSASPAAAAAAARVICLARA
jgi:hypothetical protein